MEVTTNESQRLFIIPAGNGYTSMGFDVVYRHLRALAEKLGTEVTGEVKAEDIGTTQQYQQYRAAWNAVGDRKLGTWFDPETPPAVRRIIENYRKSGDTIRIFCGDPKTGRDWMSEYDVLGTVGRSCGRMQIPLLIASGEDGGSGMLDQCIVRICDANTRKELYRHPKYHLGAMELRQLPPEDTPYTHGVWVAGSVHAKFKSMGKAAQWIAFMTGECMEQPA